MSNQDKPQQPSTEDDSNVVEYSADDIAPNEPVDTTATIRKKPKKEAKKGAGFIAWFALFASMICMAAIGGAYWLWQKQQTIEQQQTQQWQAQQTSQMQTLEQQLTQQVNEKLAASQSTMQTSQQQAQADLTKTLVGRLSAMDTKMAEVSGRQPNDWALAEANYLIRIAGRKLWLEDDIQTAQHLLATADVTIAQLNDQTLYPLRELISRDIAILRALPNPRITDIHLTLSGLISTLDILKINTIEVYTEKAREVKDNTLSDSPTDWQENLLKSADQFLSKLLFVDSGVAEGGIEPLKMPRQQWYLRANLKMAMLQAQVAVLNRDKVVFRDTVTRAIEWLKHFKQTDSAVKAASLTLSSLLNDPIVADYPLQFGSQKMLEKILHERLGEVYQNLPAIVAPTEPVAPDATVTPAAPVNQGDVL